ncbi:MAG TPA: universal stress protein [Cryomorphaceae bacterium]|nr:universal stress protein [Cryomorphaceae bacterium]
MTRALVFLDLSEMDLTLMRQIAQLNRTFEIDKLYIAHYIELQEFTGDLKVHFPNLERPIEDILNEELTERAQESGLDPDKIEVVLFQDGSKTNMMSYINQSDVDFCILGKKIVHQGTGIFSGRMARLLHKPILFTTETSRLQLEHILVAIDFSSFSKKALNFALPLLTNSQQKLTAYHVFRLPGAYFPFVGGGGRNLQDKQAEDKLKRLRKFIAGAKKADEIELVVEHAGEKTLGRTIYDYARSHFTDLIVVGVKGTTDKDELLIGSVAEQLIAVDKDLPVLLVK